jgi:hypothetical protein
MIVPGPLGTLSRLTIVLMIVLMVMTVAMVAVVIATAVRASAELGFHRGVADAVSVGQPLLDGKHGVVGIDAFG